MVRSMLTGVCLLAWLVGPPWGDAGTAAAQADEARRFLEKRHASVQRVLKQPAGNPAALARRDARLDRMLGNLLDYETLSQRSLAKHWEDRSDDQRKEFVSLLKQLVERSYKRNLRNTLDYRVRYTEADDRDGGALVKTVARSRKNPRAPSVSIDYRLHRVDGQWRVYDVITDGVSMVRNYRNQFNRIISKEGWAGLLERMRSKLADDEQI